MSRFDKFIPFIFKWEGGYDNDPDDPGGETKFGIDKRSHPDVDIKNLTKEHAAEIYRKEYWERAGCESCRYPLGEVMMNAAVNCGIGRMKKLLARADESATLFIHEQEAFYRRLVEQRPRSQKYLRGWLNRLNDLKRTLKL